MLHIRPVLEEDASEKVRETYADIKKTLNTHFVPLLFQYIAGFEEYFLYSWDKVKTNLESDYYKNAVKDIIQLSQKSIHAIYHESKQMHAFIASMHEAEKRPIAQTVEELEQLNATLLILTIGLREGVKGVVIGQQVLPRNAEEYEETVFDQFINEKIMHANLRSQEKDIAPASKMLAPLFGGSSLIVSKYPSFFAHIAQEMDELVKTEKYLHERVAMEHATLLKALNLQYPLGCTYAEIALFAGKQPYFSELLYILSETFPTKFPRLVFTSSLMQKVLHSSSKEVALQ
ncbi:MAG TPA: hypothetical protein VEW42_01260 [Candidatus Eisenbacteria bacterium]|nr:hypothetical protein [Candidatus Eisenbacteria bacterium]